MKGRVIRPEAGDLIFLSRKKFLKHQAVAAVENIKKATSAKRKTGGRFCFLSCDNAITL